SRGRALAVLRCASRRRSCGGGRWGYGREYVERESLVCDRERDEDSVQQARTRAVADGEQVARRPGQGGLTRGDRVEQFGELRNALAPGRVAQQGDRHGRRGVGCGSGDSGGEYGRSRRAERVQADQRAREDVVAERRQPWSAAEQPPDRRMDGLPATQPVNQ